MAEKKEVKKKEEKKKKDESIIGEAGKDQPGYGVVEIKEAE